MTLLKILNNYSFAMMLKNNVTTKMSNFRKCHHENVKFNPTPMSP